VRSAKDGEIEDCFAEIALLFPLYDQDRVDLWVDGVRVDEVAQLTRKLEEAGAGTVLVGLNKN
jgi:hypothetical protein